MTLFARIFLGIGLIGCLLFPAGAGAATAEDLQAVCRPKSFAIPTTELVRTAADIRRKAPVRILAIGSSSTEGIGATDKQFTYPARLMTELNSRNTIVNVDVRNAGIGGETIEQTITRLLSELDTYKPDLVLWQVGTNDAISGGGNPGVFRKLVDEGIKAVLQHHIDIILIDQQFYLKIPDSGRYERYIEYVHAAAEANNITFFPRYKLMQAWNAEAGGVTRMLGPDGFHMGDRGYTCLANLLADEITTSIARTNAKLAQP